MTLVLMTLVHDSAPTAVPFWPLGRAGFKRLMLSWGLGTDALEQWFPNFLGRDPKERLDVCPGPKLVKTADLQAHNAPLCVASLIFL